MKLEDKSILLFGMGKSLKSLGCYLDSRNLKYDIYDDLDKNEIKDEYDLIVKSPGVNLNHELLKRLKGKVVSDLELFLFLNQSEIRILITGSSAKTTVTTFVSEVLGLNAIGNIGKPLFDYANIKEDVVVEASSYMLESIDKARCDIYVITNLFANHLDHHETIDKYFNSKLKILENLNEDDVIIYLKKYEKYINRYNFKGRKVILDININDNNINDIDIIDVDKINYMFVSAIVKEYYKLKLDKVRKRLPKLKYRQNIEYESDSLIIINDSKATNILSLKASLDRCLRSNYDIYLIMGGEFRKNQNIKEELEEIDIFIYNIKYLYLFGEVSFDLSVILGRRFKYEIVNLKDLDIQNIINSIASPQKTCILFCPGFPSLDEFKSYLDRGALFRKLVKLIDFNSI